MVNEFSNLKKLDSYLNLLIKHGGSDLHMKAGSIIRIRINGELKKVGDKIFTKNDSVALAQGLAGGDYDRLLEQKSLDFSYALGSDYRFRVNIFLQLDGISFVFRVIPAKIPSIDDLKLPKIIKKISDETMRGLILITGPTGSGKTTTIASMIDRINNKRNSHIITIEDPVEFVFKDDRCIINQRSIGSNCNNFADSLRAALREDPDIIFVGEMRDLETIETALHAAETGHLVLSTLHTIDAKESINRVVSMFEKEEQERIRLSLASVLAATISQRLAISNDGGRRAVVEVLIKNTRIKDMILENRIHEIPDAIQDGKNTYGMQTFDQHLLELYEQGIVSKDEALDKSTNRGDLDIMIKNIIAKKTGGQSKDENLIKLQDV
ncbi:PilT/PilU family type 4a pilus ATPase [Campylobacter sp. FMV-PI01]|uniref:PilT/PilU family type 4a pilus ATPase n=1 Tax=Campylobacter portucalensis TaxID=2608384 RepID=A0A6L5WHH5_9BACT|nr:PilT/PilU family type 4a pilus ATPase [Campylobacter portucalensis]MSN95657.1 PilT/PilU family type 4a pilus ATPase [Campylobacter portucalensis]